METLQIWCVGRLRATMREGRVFLFKCPGAGHPQTIPAEPSRQRVDLAWNPQISE